MASPAKVSLLNLLLMSGKRKNLLFFLKEGPKNLEEITQVLNEPPTSILPQIKKLREYELISREGKEYALTKIGRILVLKMEPLVDTLELFEENPDYWASRELQGIPQHLLDRIGELGHCQVLEPELSRIFEFPAKYMENLLKSRYILHFSSHYIAHYSSLYSDLLKRNIVVSFIVTKDFFETLKTNYPENLSLFVGSKNSSLFVYEGAASIPSFTVTDRFMSLMLADKKGKFDMKLLMGFDEKALAWGKELFIYYKERSKEIMENISESTCP